MATTRTAVTGSAAIEFGIVPEHWDIFAQAAARTGFAILVRAGKRAAVPWIKQAYPAKPLLFKACKVDEQLGLLVAKTPEQRREALAQPSCYLEPLPQSISDVDRFVQSLVGRKTGRLSDVSDEQGESGGPALVVERSSGRPFTSDYDLAAIVDTKEPNYNVTFMSQGSLAETKSRTNWTLEAITLHLNQHFGDERIKHGSEAQYSGQAANKDDDGLILFRPEGRVEFMQSGTALNSWQIIRDLMIEYHAEMEDSFNN